MGVCWERSILDKTGTTAGLTTDPCKACYDAGFYAIKRWPSARLKISAKLTHVGASLLAIDSALDLICFGIYREQARSHKINN